MLPAKVPWRSALAQSTRDCTTDAATVAAMESVSAGRMCLSARRPGMEMNVMVTGKVRHSTVESLTPRTSTWSLLKRGQLQLITLRPTIFTTKTDADVP